MRLSKVFVALSLVAVAFTVRSSAQPAATGSFVAGEVLVKFRPGAAASALADAHRVAGATPRTEIARTRIQLVSVPAGDEAAVIARYRRNPNVLYAEPNFIRSLPRPASHSPGSEVVPTEFWFDEQWALHNTGQQFQCIPWINGELCFYVGTPDADVDAPEAWGISTGSAEIRVAVIDSGIDYSHPDLIANYAGGVDFLNADSDPMDDHGHGTHLAGTIAAALNNQTGTPPAAEGVVGVAPNARILAYKVCGVDGSCSDFAMAQAIAQAVTDGARVINMSIGDSQYSQSLDDAVQDAWNAGLVIVAAAGNDGGTALTYPAAFNNVVSVAAFDEDHRRATFSNYGSWVDMSAPGNAIMSTYPVSACGVGTTPGDTGCYTWLSGTSMASPHVAGAAALVWSRADVTNNSQVVDILVNSADPQGVANVRLDSWTVNGGLNLHNALSYGSTNVAPVANAGSDQIVTDSDANGGELVALDGSGSSDADGAIIGYEWSEGSSIIASGATPSVLLGVGVHTLTLRVTDDDGATATDTVVVTVSPGNQAPGAVSTSVSTVVGTPVTALLAATDTGTCELIFSIVQAPASGTLSAIQNQACSAGNPNSDTAQVTYTPAAAGTFSFTYKANDGAADSNVATVTITVNDPPSTTLSVTAISPNVVSQNAGVVSFTITGTGFASGAGVAFVNGSGQTPRVLSVQRNSSTQLTATVEIRAGGPKKNRQWDVRVTNPGGTAAVGAHLLTITP